MRHRTRILAAALTAAFALAIGAGMAQASVGIEVEPATGLRATATRLVFSESGGGGTRVTCDVTLSGSLHELILKAREELAGYITEGRANTCSSSVGGTVTAEPLVRPTAPWHLEFLSFTGTLPDIETVTLWVRDTQFLFRIRIFLGSIGCLYRGDITTTTRNNPVTDLTVNPDLVELRQQLEGASLSTCPARGRLTGSFRLANPVELILLEEA